jgi:APA family basic amino acid/polyamine antiporter
MQNKTQKVGLITATSLVVGNMIGAGIYVLPATLAGYGSITIVGWILSALGALVLAKIFGNFSKIIVNKSGGPYTYTREGFGDFIGFLVAWGYWICIWVGNAAIVIALIAALSFFFPILETNKVLSVGVGLAFIWFFSWINSRGVKESGRIQVITTIIKLLPLVLIILIGAFMFDINNFPDFNLTGESNLSTIPLVATLTLYAFLGLECATIPAENIINPEKIVPKATIYGTMISTVIYILSTVVLFGMLPVDVLKNSPAPFAEASKLIGGEFAGYFVAAGAAVSAIGALNGWILVSGQIPMATARDKLFPRIFKKENSKGAPAVAIVIGSLLTSVVMLMNFSESLVDQFEIIVLLSTFTALVPYLFTSASYALVIIEHRFHLPGRGKAVILAGLGISYSLWAIFGSGQATVFYGTLLLLLGIPFYILMSWNKKRKG